MARSWLRLVSLCGGMLAACTNDFGQFDFSGVGSPEAGTGAASAGGVGSLDASAGGSGGSGGGASGRGGLGSGGADPTDGSVASGGAPPIDSGGDVRDGTPEASGPDVGTSSDAGQSDASTALADARGPDARGPDATADAPAPSCDALYGAANGYTACSETSTTCAFSARTNGSNCEVLCASLGGTCIDADDNRSATPCVANGTADTCQTNRMEELCTCSRP